jgi:hypothetical protein
MDTSLTIKPRDTSRSAVARTSVRTEVAPSESVTSVVAPRPVHHGVSTQDTATRDLVDPYGQEVLYRARDEEEKRREQRRASDEALRRQRAYGQAVAGRADPEEKHEIEVI